VTFDQIITNIRNKVYSPLYFLMGEEPYFIDTISDFLEETVLEPMYREFNLIVVYGRDVDVSAIINQARSYPMTGNYQLFIVKEAQDVKDIEKLEPLLTSIPKSTILVINYKYKKLDKRKTFTKLVEKQGVLFESKKLYDNNIPDWIIKFLQQRNYAIEPKACQMLADYLGTDLHKVRNELEKLMINLPVKSRITEDDVERNTGISKDFNIFELQKALGFRDIFKANQIINYFGANSKDNPIQMVVVLLYSYFLKILKIHYAPDKSKNGIAGLIGVNPFLVDDYLKASQNYNIAKLVEIIALLREFDLKGKGLGSQNIDDGELYKEMVFRILH
jgi:DNA polymerase-3 subunit delta